MISPPATGDVLANGIIFWFFVAAWAIVLGLLAFAVLPAAFREARRIVTRVIALGADSPLPLQIAKAEADLVRMQDALDRLPRLQSRAQAALRLIRTTPVIPPALLPVIARTRAEIAAFRGAFR